MRLIDQRVEFGVGVERHVAARPLVLAVKKWIQKVLRVRIVRPPLLDVEVGRSLASGLAYRRCIALNNLRPDSRFGQISLNRLREARRLVGCSGPQLDVDSVRMSSRSEQLLCLGEIMRVCFATAIEPWQDSRNNASRNIAAAGHHHAQDRVHIGCVIERLSHANVAQGSPRHVYRYVPEAERRRGIEKFFLLWIRLPRLSCFVRNGEHVDVACLEFSGGSAHLRNDARHQRIGFRRAVEIVRILCKPQVIVVPPFDELPRASAHWLLAEVGGRIIGHDGSHWHCQQLGEDRERLFERDHDRRVVGSGNTTYRLSLTSGEIFGALNWKKWPTAPALRLWIEDTLECGDDVLRGERTSVVELDSASKMERVSDSV